MNHRNLSSLKRDKIALCLNTYNLNPNIASMPMTIHSQSIVIIFISTMVSNVEVIFHVGVIQEVAGFDIEMAVCGY